MGHCSYSFHTAFSFTFRATFGFALMVNVYVAVGTGGFVGILGGMYADWCTRIWRVERP